MNEKINLSTQDIYRIINNCLDDKVPLAIIRYDDGESMMFNGVIEDTHFILKKVLGYIPSEGEIALMKENLIKAYKECDVIGIPTERHLAREDRWKDSLAVFKNAVSENTLMNKFKTSVDIFYDLLKDNLYAPLFTGINTLNYISCRNLDDVFKEKFGIENVNSFIISPEPTYTSGWTGDKHFPEQFLQIEQWIKTVPCEGNLCLVGAGIPGKIYNNWFRDQGGVSLDLGSIFDAWAGAKTRGKGRGLDVYDNINKL